MSDQAAEEQTSRVLPAKWVQRIYLLIGLFFVGLGALGAFLPVLPTTPFMIVAVACFTRSSVRLETWLLQHKRFGPLLRDWRVRGAIPPRAKTASLIGTVTGYAMFWIGGSPGPLLAGAVAGLMLFGLIYVFSRPS